MSGRRPARGATEGQTIAIERRRLRSPQGLPLEVLHARFAPDLPAALVVDERFLERGIETPDRLIDLAATEARWGAPVGLDAKDVLAAAGVGTLALCPTNFGWQHGTALVADGALLRLPGDRHLSGERLIWGRGRGGGWEVRRLDLCAIERGDRAQRAEIRSLSLGLEMPAIVSAGRPVPRERWIIHARLLADLRNAFDFAQGRGTELPDDLWAELRQVLPASAASALALCRGESCRERRPLAGSDAERLAARVRAAGLDHLAIRGLDARTVEVSVRGPLPHARLPLVGIGCRADGSLDLTLIDGRRPGLPGATIEELASIMARRGVVRGGLGSAGGDVALLRHGERGVEILNRPSGRAAPGGGPRMRRMPSLLLLGPAD